MAKQTTKSDDESEGLTILAALAQLKQEIYQLQEEAIQKRELPMFLIEEGELELKLVVRKERKVEGKLQSKFKLYVLDTEASVGGSQTGTREAVQTLKIKFRALRRDAPGAAPEVEQGGAAQQTLLPPSPLTAALPVVEAKNLPSGATDTKFGW